MRASIQFVLTAFAMLGLHAGPLAAEPVSLSIHECAETQTCDATGNCVTNKTRLVVAQLNGTAEGPYLSIGPLAPEAAGGLFLQHDWSWVLGGVPAPSAKLGRANILSIENGINWRAYVFRPGSEVPGLKGSDWVRADYTCKQVLF